MGNRDIHHGFHVLRQGGKWMAIGPDFVDLERSTVGFGDTPEEAMTQWRLRRARTVSACGQRMPTKRDFIVHYEDEAEDEPEVPYPLFLL
jgi:hypothetical protein